VYGAGIDIGCFESPGYTGNDQYVLPVSQALSLSNYPNPFNPETTIQFDIAEESTVKLQIYNIRGQLVKILVNTRLNAGKHSIVWNGTNENKEKVSSGIYLYKVSSGEENRVNKMILMK
ncbi:T9SS type A sorting domain-containing protein, partial [bacterium]|nr:T9SS type A sorting domain-containing protein [bacterium]